MIETLKIEENKTRTLEACHSGRGVYIEVLGQGRADILLNADQARLLAGFLLAYANTAQPEYNGEGVS